MNTNKPVGKHTLFKMIALDLDGTLLTKEKLISHEGVNCIKKIQSMVHAVICSGRRTDNVKLMLKGYDLDLPVIGMNGAWIIKPDGHETRHFIPPEIVSPVIDRLKELKADFIAFSPEYTVVCDENTCFSQTEQGIKFLHDITNGNYKKTNDIADIKKEKIFKISSIHMRNPEYLLFVRSSIMEFKNINISKSSNINVEIAPLGINKKSGIIDYADGYGISHDEIMAIGDEENDIPMIQFAGLGIAMGNAPDIVKQAAKFVTSSNEEDGVAKAINKYIAHFGACHERGKGHD
jgi:Cof subfamily protein (haloacid dehalogenase superfamily)